MEQPVKQASRLLARTLLLLREDSFVNSDRSSFCINAVGGESHCEDLSGNA